MMEESDLNKDRQPEETASPDEETIVRPMSGIPFKRGPEFRVVYANSVRFAAAPWDFSLVFGQTIVDVVDDLHIEDKVTVTLSPQTAKAMADILVKNLHDYEAQFGEIRYNPIQSQTDKLSA
jgi:hypothetical protein